MIAASDSPIEPVRVSSSTMRTREQWRDGEERVAIERSEGAEIEHRRLDAVGGEALGHSQGGVHVRAVRDDRQILAGAAERGLAEWDGGGRLVG